MVEKQGRRLIAKDGEITLLDTREAEATCNPGEAPEDVPSDGRRAG